MSLQQLRNYQQQIQNCPNYSTYLNKASLQLQLNQYHPAIQSSSQAIHLISQKSQAYLVRGKAYSFLGNYNQAENNFKKAMIIDDRCPQAYYQYGYTLNRQKKYYDGLKMFQKGISKDRKNNAFAYLGRSFGFAELNEIQSSRKNMEYATRAQVQLQSIQYLSKNQKIIIKQGIQLYGSLKQIMNKKSYEDSTKFKFQRQLIHKIVHATQLNNGNILDTGYKAILERIQSNNQLMKTNNQGEQKTPICNCHENCVIF